MSSPAPAAGARRLLRVALLTTAGLAVAPQPVRAETFSWTGTASSDWSDDVNWDLGAALPGLDDDVLIGATLPHPVLDGDDVFIRNIDVGTYSTGALTIVNGGTLSVGSGRGYIGWQAGSSGTVTVTGAGSNWSHDNNLYVGENGTGTLTVTDAGTVSDSNGFVGWLSGSEGTLTVTGAGSTWTHSADLYVGHDGTGTLTVADGATVSDSAGYVGYGEDSSGTVMVTGAGSTWSHATGLVVGGEGTGALTIAEGGMVSHGNSVGAIGAQDAGTVTVSGAGSTWTGIDAFYVGVESTGALSISDGGTVDNSDGYIGYAASGAGTVTVSGVGSTWTSTDSLAVGVDGAGTPTIAEGGSVEVAGGAGTVDIGSPAAGQGTLNIGAAAGTPAAAAGTLNAAAVAFGDGTGEINFNHTANDYEFAPSITGDGSVNLLAGTTRLTGANIYTGGTTVSGGTLVVNGSPTGGVDVQPGAILGGSGIVAGGVTVSGTIAPGNSIGTLAVDGDYTQADGSTYQVEIDPAGNSDLIEVSGTATIEDNTAVLVEKADGAYVPGTRYTILTADGGVAGTYDTLDGDTLYQSMPFMSLQLAYDPNNVMLELLRNDVAFAAVARTANQRETARRADSLGAGNDVHDAIAGLDEPSARGAFDNLSGEIHATALGVAFEQSDHFREGILRRLRDTPRSAIEREEPAGPTATNTAKGAAGADTDRHSRAVWLESYGAIGEWDGDGNAAAVDTDTHGLMAGLEFPATSALRLGLAGGYQRDQVDVDDRASSTAIDTWNLGVYGAWERRAFRVRGGAAYASHAFDTNRSITVPGLEGRATSDHDGWTAQAFGEIGYLIEMGDTQLEPFAGITHVRTETDDFAESGAGAARLSSDGASLDTTYSTLGIRVGAILEIAGDMALEPHASVAWDHAFSEVTPAAELAFAGAGAFTVSGPSRARDNFRVGAGLNLTATDTVTVFLAYQGGFAEGSHEHAASGGFRVRF